MIVGPDTTSTGSCSRVVMAHPALPGRLRAKVPVPVDEVDVPWSAQVSRWVANASSRSGVVSVGGCSAGSVEWGR